MGIQRLIWLLLIIVSKEEEEGIKMQVSNFVPTVNEAAATYKGQCYNFDFFLDVCVGVSFLPWSSSLKHLQQPITH